jgi:hypothetical protein
MPSGPPGTGRLLSAKPDVQVLENFCYWSPRRRLKGIKTKEDNASITRWRSYTVIGIKHEKMRA